MSALSWIGLFVGIVGPLLVILPTIPRFERFIVDQTTIDNLNECRKKLPKNYMIDENMAGFDRFSRIIRENMDGGIVDGCKGYRVPKIGYTSEQGHQVFQHGTIVYSVDQCAADKGNPINEDHSEEVESLFVVDGWMRDHIDYLVNIRVQTVRGIGLLLIVISVFLQGYSGF